VRTKLGWTPVKNWRFTFGVDVFTGPVTGFFGASTTATGPTSKRATTSDEAYAVADRTRRANCSKSSCISTERADAGQSRPAAATMKPNTLR